MGCISALNLKFGYHPKALIIDIDRFDLAQGESVFLYGPSGSGKSTFLGLAAGVLKATQGSLEVLGVDFTQAPERKKDHLRGSSMGYIFQIFNLLPYLDVLQNVLLPYQLNPDRGSLKRKDEQEAEARKLCENLGLQDKLHHSVLELSIGQQQRVAAARALVGSPKLIIADEPTSALDSDHRGAFVSTLLTQAKASRASILFVSHDRSLAPLFDRSVSLLDINKGMARK